MVQELAELHDHQRVAGVQAAHVGVDEGRDDARRRQRLSRDGQ
jgi:hypothetical protein